MTRSTTHILKPPIPGMVATTENEAFAMRLAAALGLTVAPVETRVAGDRSFLLVERYDRRVEAGGSVQHGFAARIGERAARLAGTTQQETPAR